MSHMPFHHGFWVSWVKQTTSFVRRKEGRKENYVNIFVGEGCGSVGQREGWREEERKERREGMEMREEREGEREVP